MKPNISTVTPSGTQRIHSLEDVSVLTEMKHRYYIKEFGEPARKMFEEDGIL